MENVKITEEQREKNGIQLKEDLDYIEQLIDKSTDSDELDDLLRRIAKARIKIIQDETVRFDKDAIAISTIPKYLQHGYTTYALVTFEKLKKKILNRKQGLSNSNNKSVSDLYREIKDIAQLTQDSSDIDELYTLRHRLMVFDAEFTANREQLTPRQTEELLYYFEGIHNMLNSKIFSLEQINDDIKKGR